MKLQATEEPGPTTRERLWNRLSSDSTSGVILLVAALVAFVFANSPWREAYFSLTDLQLGPASLHLDLTLTQWATDGLLAIFFFVVGVELKYEIVRGSLSKPREAAVPAIAAVAGMALPAILYTVIVLTSGQDSALRGWAIPTATDIAFALAVLAIFGRRLPRALRTFLLTLAVVDDLLAILVIAVFYTASIGFISLALSLACIGLFGWMVRWRKPRWWLLLPVAVIAWYFMHDSGVHATIAGVLLGLTVPAKNVHGETYSRAHKFDYEVRPYSSAIALPIFAFFSAGVAVIDKDNPLGMLVDPLVIAIVVGLVVGKLIGILGITSIITKFTPLRLPDAIGVRDLLPIGLLGGIGFTVSLLIAELSFPVGVHHDESKLAILVGSLVAGIAAALTLRWDSRKARKKDMNLDGIPDTDTTPIGDGPEKPE